MAAYHKPPQGALNGNPMVEIPTSPLVSALQQQQHYASIPQNGASPPYPPTGYNLQQDQHHRAPVSLAAVPGPGQAWPLHSQQDDPNRFLDKPPSSSLKIPKEGARDDDDYRTAPTTPEMPTISAPDNYGRGPEPPYNVKQDTRNVAPVVPPRPFSSPGTEPHFSPTYDNRPVIPRSNTGQYFSGGFAPSTPYATGASSTPVYDMYRAGPPNQGFSQVSNPSMITNRIHEERKVIYFYDMHAKYYEFTNFSPDPVPYEGKFYPTSEHLFQAMKFIKTRPLLAEHIRTYSNRPRDAFMEARRFQPEWDPSWHSIKIQRMDEVLDIKFNSTSELRNLLLNTEDAVLVEDSPVDDFWGCGADRKGKNELGLALMRLRDKIRGASQPYSEDLIQM